jgi:hypothetical protein
LLPSEPARLALVAIYERQIERQGCLDRPAALRELADLESRRALPRVARVRGSRNAPLVVCSVCGRRSRQRRPEHLGWCLDGAVWCRDCRIAGHGPHLDPAWKVKAQKRLAALALDGPGQRLLARRIALNLSLHQVAGRAGVSISTVHDSERVPWRRLGPKSSTLEALARVLGVSVQWILTGEEDHAAPQAGCFGKDEG